MTHTTRGSVRKMLVEAGYSPDDQPLEVIPKLLKEIRRLDAYLNTPQDGKFIEAVEAEMAHQRTRWDDTGKTPVDWGGVAAFLSQKAVQAAYAGDDVKARHHCVSTAAVMANWHRDLQPTPPGGGPRP